MATNFELVKEFHKLVGHVDPTKPNENPDMELVEFRKKLIKEEYFEVMEALSWKPLDEIAKEFCDLLYVVYGAGASLGIPMDEAFEIVHRSNLTKVGGGMRPDGKFLKGPNYQPPDLSFLRSDK